MADDPMIAALFGAALEVPFEEQAAFVRARCGGNQAVYGEVMELLSVDAERGPSAIDVAFRRDAWRGAVSFRAGHKVGRYEILDQIGEGGFAVVYLAQEDEVRRRVALKTLKAGMQTKLVLTRFEAERQTLALMDHPFIAQVFDAGATEQGLPYLVMEYVEGTPITEHCARHDLGLEQRLRLFIKCCEAVQHAHLKAIIHRDLKPSNILVRRIDGGSVPKIIDFGVAKAIGQKLTLDTLQTAGGVLMGTPAYMSPEQLEVEGKTGTDTRVDVYALGVVLYELLVGKRPFGSSKPGALGLAEVLRAIREDEVPRPSARVSSPPPLSPSAGGRPAQFSPRQLAGDLDWIVLKALAKDRDRRYDSPRELAADLERYLESKPIKARPPSLAYRTAKFLRRNTAAVAASGVISISLLILAGGAVMQAQRERRAQRELLSVAEFQAARFEDIDAYRMGEQLRRDLLAQLSASGSEASPDASYRLDSANFTTLAAAAIESHFFAPSLAAVEAEFAEQPEIKARLLQSLVDEMAEAGIVSRAMVAQEQALAIRRRVLGGKHPDTLESIYGMGSLLHEQGKVEEAELMVREALAGRREVLGNTDPLTLDAMERLGILLRERGHFSEAERYYREALEGRRLVLGARNYDTLNAIGHLLESQGKLAEAERFYAEALEVQRETLGETDVNTLASRANLGYILFRQSKFDVAEMHIRRAIEGSRKTLGEEHLTTLDAQALLARLCVRQRRFAEAEQLLQRSLEGLRRSAGDEHHLTLVAVGDLADLRAKQGRLEDSAALYFELTETQRKVLGPDHPHLLITYSSGLGSVLIAQKRYTEAEALLQKNLVALTETLGEGHWRTAECRSLLGEALVGLERLTEAEPLLLDGYAQLESAVPKGRRREKLGDAARRVEAFYRKRGETKEAADGHAKVP